MGNLDQLSFLQEAGIEEWTLDILNPNRLKLLAQIAHRSAGQALQRAPAERHYPILTAFLSQSLTDITDETLNMFDRCLWESSARAEQELEAFRKSVTRTTTETLILFKDLGRAVLDPTIGDTHLRRAIYQRIAPDMLRQAVTTCEKITRPLDDNHFDFLEHRYSYLRQFTPALLDAFSFQSNVKRDPLLQAIEVLRRLNAEQRRVLPADAPLDFVPSKWWPYVVNQAGYINRHYYELCVLWELRGALRAGNIWLAFSRRYANPETYLIPTDQWPELRPDHQPLAAYWGGGTLSSSDGQRFPTSGKIRNATALPRYFGYGRGVTFYTWTSDQFSQYGTKVIRYLENEEYRRRINTQLNKGEALHALRRFLFFANEGTVRRKQEEAQANQASCLNLLTNAVIVWNTLYMARALEELPRKG